MKFFAIFFVAATALCSYFWVTDAPGSGMVWPTAGFAVLGAGTLIRNKRKTGYWLSDSAAGK